jgi:hypothetical protein
LKEEGRDPGDAEWLLSSGGGSRRAQASSDLRVYDDVASIYKRLVISGRKDLEEELGERYLNKALVHEYLDDTLGALGTYDQAIGIYERLVHKEGRWEMADDLAGSYNTIRQWYLPSWERVVSYFKCMKRQF